ncbi:unnamed protein product [Brassica oleracea]
MLRVLKLGLFACGETITKNQETPLKWLLLIKKGQEFMLQLVNSSSKSMKTSYMREMRLSSSCSKCTMLLVTTVQPHIRTKLAFFQQLLLEKLMSFQVKFPKSILRTTMIFLVESFDNSCLVELSETVFAFGVRRRFCLDLLFRVRINKTSIDFDRLWFWVCRFCFRLATFCINLIREALQVCFFYLDEIEISLPLGPQLKPVGAYSISSGYNSTHILLNPTLDLIDLFKARFFVLNERLTIREIIDNTLVLMLLASDEISDGSGGSSATHVSKRKSKGEEDNDVEDQLSVKKKQGQKKIKGSENLPLRFGTLCFYFQTIWLCRISVLLFLGFVF